MQARASRPLATSGLAFLVAALGWSWPSGQAAAPVLCALPDSIGSAAPLQPAATCDQCRTSGNRAGYRQCCEQIGGDYRCKWVKC